VRVRSGQVVATFEADRLQPGFERAEIRFEGLKPPAESFEVRVFVDEPDANAGTPTDGNIHYLGTQRFYGLGTPDIPPDPSDPYRFGRASQSARTTVPLNVTAALRAYRAAARAQRWNVTLVAVGRDGHLIPEPDLDIEGLSLVTT